MCVCVHVCENIVCVCEHACVCVSHREQVYQEKESWLKENVDSWNTAGKLGVGADSCGGGGW